MLIEVRDGESGENPYRTGKMHVVTDDFVRRVVNPPELRDAILKARVAFIEAATLKAMGFDGIAPTYTSVEEMEKAGK